MAEREMNKHQHGMVDGCFEEGHYQQGIAALNQLRMQNLRPSAAHIRQLIYISLYPPPISKDDANDKGKRKETLAAVSGSPSKQIQQARRLQKQALFPSLEATQAAIELLHQFAIDSTKPESLMRAVPCYSPTQTEIDNSPRPIDTDMFFRNSEDAEEDMDSYISKQALKLKECKDCWSMLRHGVVKRQDAVALCTEDPSIDVEEDNDERESSSVIVGRHSWHLLEWFILLFEKDRALVIDSGRAPEDSYSLLLLTQIKPPSRGGEPRTYIDSVLDVVFVCYNQMEYKRRSMGKRLMALLVTLTRCSDFSPLQLFTTIGIRLHASPTNLVAALLSDLPITPLGLTFKLAICDRFFTYSLRSSAALVTSGMSRARPQARRARPVSAFADGDTSSPSRSQSIAPNQISLSKWNLPAAQQVLRFLESKSPTQLTRPSSISDLIVLFHLIAAFGTLRTGEGRDADPSWINAVLSGDLEQGICDTFTDTGRSEDDRKVVKPLRRLLLRKCASWKESLA